MQITGPVKTIPSRCEGCCVGTKTDRARLLMHGRLGGTGRRPILPVDQGVEHGPARSFAPDPAAHDPPRAMACRTPRTWPR